MLAINAPAEIDPDERLPCVVIKNTSIIARPIADISDPFGSLFSITQETSRIKIGDRSCRIVVAPVVLSWTVRKYRN
jgi:hypothetical protein